MQDREIVNMIKNRDEAALAEIKDKYGRYLLKVAYNILGDTLDSEEALDDAILNAWNAVPKVCPEDLRSYLVKLLRHCSIDILRKRNGGKHGGPGADIPIDEFFDAVSCLGDPEKELDSKLLSEAVNSWLGGISREKRRMFIMRYFYSDSILNISKSLGKSEPGVRTSLYRLRQDLRDYLIRKNLIN